MACRFESEVEALITRVFLLFPIKVPFVILDLIKYQSINVDGENGLLLKVCNITKQSRIMSESPYPRRDSKPYGKLLMKLRPK
ncbi:hypothetical protein LguiA_029243 [Lonicera macranthoides]